MMTRKVSPAGIDAHDDVALSALESIQQRSDHQTVGLEHVRRKHVARSRVEPFGVHTARARRVRDDRRTRQES